MSKKALKHDEVGYWSEIKLDIVKKYASAYSTILAKQNVVRAHLYIDAFAGAGTHLSKTTGEMIAGSPVNAMAIQPPFSELHFIDMDGTRTGELRGIAADDRRVIVHDGDCNEVLLRDVFPRCRYEDYRRALCLLDPYGLSVDWDVLKTAGQMKSVEIFYNFMIMDANMNALKKDPSKVARDQSARMDAMWGDNSWRSSAYKTTQDLLGDVETKDSNDAIAEAFRKRLKQVAGFAYVPKPIPMRNEQGAVIYYLYFASPKDVGGKIVEEIFETYRTRGAH